MNYLTPTFVEPPKRGVFVALVYKRDGIIGHSFYMMGVADSGNLDAAIIAGCYGDAMATFNKLRELGAVEIELVISFPGFQGIVNSVVLS